ncbi:MAG: ArnT family glycosyltransferase [Candidatus Methylacidiphilales bacterium]
MAGIQEIVYAIEVGSLRQWLVRLGILALLSGLGVFYFVKQFNGLKHPESMDMAQLSRQIATGEGYTTKFFRPIQIKKTSPNQADLSRLPDVVNPPVYPYLAAALFKVSGVGFAVDADKLKFFSGYAPERLLVLMNLGLTIMSVIVLYLWMLRMFDARVATLSAVLFAVTDLVWATSVWGLSTPLVTLWVCLLGFFVNEALVAEENEAFTLSYFWFSLAATVCGLAILTCYTMIVLWIPLVGLALLAFDRKMVTAALALVIPMLMIAPWCYRNFELTGHPFGLSWIEIFVDNGKYAGNSLWRVYEMGVDSPGGLKPLLRALSLGFAHLAENMGAFLGGLVPIGLALAGCFHSFRRHRCQTARWMWVAAFVLLMIFNGALVKERMPMDVPGLNWMITFLPMVCGFGAAFTFVLIDRLKLPSSILVIPLVGILCAIQAAPLALRVVQKPAPAYAYPPYFPPMLFVIKNWVQPSEVMCSDIPWAVAWYSDRRTVWLPYKRSDFFALTDFKVGMVAILLTPESQSGQLFRDIENGPYAEWVGIITRREFKDLPLPAVTVLPPNNDDYLFFADRPRWK